MRTIANQHLTSEPRFLTIRSSKVGIRVFSLLIGCAIVGSASSAMAQSILRRNSQGQAVIELQNRLQELGCYDGSITGFFGEQTEAAVIRCQQRAGITADGVVGAATSSAFGLSGTPVNSGTSQYGAPLQLGDRGSGVRELQTRLRDRGYYYGQIDGVFGTDTQTAVLQLQRDINRPLSGVADASVYAALNGNRPTPLPAPVGLQPGDQNSRVTDLQRQLDRLGYSVEATGFYGTQTESAVRRFQQSNFLPVTGVADARTLSEIRGASGGTSASLNTRRYAVVIPIPGTSDLRRVQQIIPNAVPRQSRLGNFVRAGVYNTPEEAERRAAVLRSRGLPDTRVVFD
jgi:peptidoglycan hydrolase-like protein with peptidoglycan-binding domain